jgi:hypothetical protein
LIERFQKSKLYNEKFILNQKSLKKELHKWSNIIKGFIALKNNEATEESEELIKVYQEWRGDRPS